MLVSARYRAVPVPCGNFPTKAQLAQLDHLNNPKKHPIGEVSGSRDVDHECYGARGI